MSDVVPFPARGTKPKPNPTSLVVEFDLGQWTIRFSFHGRFHGRRYFGSEEEAQAEAERLVEKHGLSWDEPSPKGAA